MGWLLKSFAFFHLSDNGLLPINIFWLYQMKVVFGFDLTCWVPSSVFDWGLISNLSIHRGFPSSNFLAPIFGIS